MTKKFVVFFPPGHTISCDDYIEIIYTVLDLLSNAFSFLLICLRILVSLIVDKDGAKSYHSMASQKDLDKRLRILEANSPG